jgi:hypothetical protein
MNYSEEAEEWIKKAGEDLAPKMRESAMFVSLFRESMASDPKCAMELGLAILNEKPIRLMVAEGTPIPAVLRKLAERIIFYKDGDEEDAKRAMLLLLDDKIKEKP